MMAKVSWRVEDRCDGPHAYTEEGDSIFDNHWLVTDCSRSFRAEYQDEAELLAAALNAYPPALEAPKRRG